MDKLRNASLLFPLDSNCFLGDVLVAFFIWQAVTWLRIFLSPPSPCGSSHSTPVANLCCWSSCLITSTGAKGPSMRITVCTDSVPSSNLVLAPHQRPWPNTTATCASRACLVPSTDKCGEVYQARGSSQCVDILRHSADANPQIRPG